jgi:pyruvate/2-oxoglutarate dehydrogenase complex dihydrolipoamide dehydrogenase (E3) component
MPHDAATFAESVKQRKSPAETAAANAAGVTAARTQYANSEAQTVEDFGELTLLTPQISTISPTTKAAGAAQFTLTVNGFDFDADAKIRWSGTQQTTTRVSANQLTCLITAGQVATAGTRTITVINGSKKISNGVTFTITA